MYAMAIAIPGILDGLFSYNWKLLWEEIKLEKTINLPNFIQSFQDNVTKNVYSEYVDICIYK